MIFEGTKNQFFFGLGLTRAGKSYPDLQVLVDISNQFGVSLDTLLKEDSKMVQSIDKERAMIDIFMGKCVVFKDRGKNCFTCYHDSAFGNVCP